MILFSLAKVKVKFMGQKLVNTKLLNLWPPNIFLTFLKKKFLNFSQFCLFLSS